MRTGVLPITLDLILRTAVSLRVGADPADISSTARPASGTNRQNRGTATDNLDRTIIEILQQDGRAPNARMSRTLHVSEGTVRRRLAKLIRERTIRVVAVAEPQQLGYHLSAVIGLRTEPGRAESVAAELASLSETEHVAVTTGRYDVLAWVNLVDAAALSEFLQHKAGVVNGVRQTETFLVLGAPKRGPGSGAA